MRLNVIHKQLLHWYRSTNRPLPWRQLWSQYHNPWHIWVSEIMLQQTVIKAVLPVYSSFLQKYPSPSELAKSSTEDIRLAVRGLGYYRRFDLLHKAAKYFVHELKTKWPSSYEEWKKVPGVGDYTASALASITLNLPHGVVDGNVERVMCRLQDIRTAPNLPELKAKFKIEMDKLALLGFPGEINQAVMELGQLVCTPTSPKCDVCPIAPHCKAKLNESQHLAPAPKARKEFKDIQLIVLLPYKQQKFSMIRRSSQAKFLKGTLGFPTLIRKDNGQISGDGFEAPQWMLEAAELKSTKKMYFKHNITHHKISAEVAVVTSFQNKEFEVSKAMDDVESLLVSNLDRKALKAYSKVND